MLTFVGLGLLCLAGLSAGVYHLWSRKPSAPTVEPAPAPAAAPVAVASDASQVRAIFEKCCFRCHGQDDEAEAGVYVLDRDKLIAKKKVVPGDPEHSRLYQKITSTTSPMPPEDETPRPSADDIALIKKWIAAGAPPLTAEATAASGSLDAGYLLTAVRDHLLKTPEQDRKYQRYFTLCHLYNNPDESKNLPVYRAGLAKLVNSLSWKKTVAQPRAVDKAGTIYVLDLRELDWDAPDRWQDLVRVYPYGLRYDDAGNAGLNSLSLEIERLAGVPLPYIRADWFLATASRPPLYYTVLGLPTNARQLEQMLGVDLAGDFLDDKLRRSGFLKSNVSSQNRMIERHDSRFGAYWRSYDFRSSQNRESLVGFPLGPSADFIRNHPFPDLAFVQAGGEFIFNLPNGLQGYMLVDGKDNRIDVGPIEVVRDREETAGTPQIVPGLSCMACHVNGMITGDNVKDVLRSGSAVDGAAKTKVEALYPPSAEMDQLLQKDADRFQRAVKRTLESFPTGAADEPISAAAKPFIKKGIDLKVAAFELGLPNPQVLQQAILSNRTLRQLGLEPLAQGSAIQRASWEQMQGDRSIFQQVASELRLGTPLR
jgi:serine/threonine-protein kinase